MIRSTDWTQKELRLAEQEGNVEMLLVSREEARALLEELPEMEIWEELVNQLDQLQGDCVDGTPRYLVLKITP